MFLPRIPRTIPDVFAPRGRAEDINMPVWARSAAEMMPNPASQSTAPKGAAHIGVPSRGKIETAEPSDNQAARCCHTQQQDVGSTA